MDIPKGDRYIESVHTAEVGGGELATFITLSGGVCVVLAFDIVGLYASEADYWEGDPVWLSEDGLVPMRSPSASLASS